MIYLQILPEGVLPTGGGSSLALTAIVWMLIIVLVAIGAKGIGWYYVNKKKFNLIIRIFEKVGGRFEPTKSDRAMLMNVGRAGDTALYLKKFKKWLPTPKQQTGRNTYWYFIREDGEWINFTMGDLDEQSKKLGAFMLDSVTPETPILIKRNGFIDFVEIQELAPEISVLKKYKDKIYTHIPDNIEIYTRNGFRKAKAIMAHEVEKEIYYTSGKTVSRTTGDHSLYQNGIEIKPSDLKVGDKIDRMELKEHYFNKSVTRDFARLLGFFCAEGSAGIYNDTRDSSRGKLYQWKLTQKDKSVLERYKRILEERYCRRFVYTQDFSPDGKIVWHLRPSGKVMDITEEFRKECYTGNSRLKKVPQFILNSNKEIIESFLEGYIQGDGHIRDNRYPSYCTNSFILSAGLAYLYDKLGLKTRHFIDESKINIINTSVSENGNSRSDGINKIISVPYKGYVYDICTEDGTFVGGVNNLLLANTDMRYARSGLQKNLRDRYEESGFWQKYGGVFAYTMLILVTGIMVFLLFDKFVEVSGAVASSVDNAGRVMEQAERILGALDNLQTSTSGSGIVPAG